MGTLRERAEEIRKMVERHDLTPDALCAIEFGREVLEAAKVKRTKIYLDAAMEEAVWVALVEDIDALLEELNDV